MEFDKDLRSVQEVRDLLAQAKKAQKALAVMTQQQLDAITAAISRAGAQHARRLADMAVEETGFGRKEDKEIKNRFAAVTLYEAIKDQKTHGILAEDKEHRTVDIGVPVGVVAGLVPSTNPTSTVIYKAMICMLACKALLSGLLDDFLRRHIARTATALRLYRLIEILHVDRRRV